MENTMLLQVCCTCKTRQNSKRKKDLSYWDRKKRVKEKLATFLEVLRLVLPTRACAWWGKMGMVILLEFRPPEYCKIWTMTTQKKCRLTKESTSATYLIWISKLCPFTNQETLLELLQQLWNSRQTCNQGNRNKTLTTALTSTKMLDTHVLKTLELSYKSSSQSKTKLLKKALSLDRYQNILLKISSDSLHKPKDRMPIRFQLSVSAHIVPHFHYSY